MRIKIKKKKKTFDQIIVTKLKNKKKIQIVKRNKGVGKLQDIAYFQTLSWALFKMRLFFFFSKFFYFFLAAICPPICRRINLMTHLFICRAVHLSGTFSLIAYQNI